MLPWIECQTLDVDLDLPVGKRFGSLWDRTAHSATELLRAIRGEMPAHAKLASYAINLRTGGRYWREARAIAKLAGADWREILAAALSYEFVVGIFACSTMAIATERGPVLARNMDFWPEDSLARATYVIRNMRRGEWTSVIAGWPGALGVVTGMSARGFAVALNAVASPGGLSKSGYPVLLFLREVIEHARDYHDAVHQLSTQHLMAGALFTVVGMQNDERVVIERTPRGVEHRVPSNGEPLVTANSYRALNVDAVELKFELVATSGGRYGALLEQCSAPAFAAADLTDDAILYALTDERVVQAITAQHIIARPYCQEFRTYVPRRFLEQNRASG